MEDVLSVYTRPHDPARPLVCLDETSKQLVAETRTPIPMRPGRFDYEYRHCGTANLFIGFAPLEGQRHVKVTDRRTKVDYAQFLRDLSDVHFPKAELIVLVQDNLNTHSPAALYEAFEPTEARRLTEASNGITRRSTEAGEPSQRCKHGLPGSAWRNWSFQFCPANACTEGSMISKACVNK